MDALFQKNMKLLFVAVLLCSSQAQLTNKKEDTLTNIHNNFDKFAKKCNVYDEAHYCHQIVVDQRLNLAAISYKCECPDGWRCPSGIADTRFVTEPFLNLNDPEPSGSSQRY
ncbi:hypothetical protein RB195_000832 [Necator americanus]|uniref:EGF-like domain-containing protein n=1 Tax=Necator americanus TaxID=51031 RepID=A0ABR1DCW0_NECAM